MAYTYTTTVQKTAWRVFLKCAGATGSSFESAYAEIGLLEEAPVLKTENGEEIKVHTGDEITISDNITFEAVLLGVTAANYTELLLINNLSTDIKFEEIVASGTVTTVECLAMKVSVNLDITGNQPKKIPIAGKKEVAPGTGVTMLDGETATA